MRNPRPRIHLLDVDEPLLAYCNLIVRCNLTIRNAAPEFMVSETAADSAELCIPTRFDECLKCKQSKPTGGEKRHYVYGLVEAQEEKDSERELETVA